MLRAMRAVRLLPFLLLVSCAQLQSIAGGGGAQAPVPPKIVIVEVGLSHHPGPDIVARALCPQVAPGLVCAALGGRPTSAELKIGFAVQLDVTNPNTIPLPLVEALVAFTAYPGPKNSNNLGAVCVSFCESGASCPVRPDACTGGGPKIKTMNDFAAAAAGFLIATAVGQTSPDALRIKTLGANQTTRVTVGLELDPNQVVSLIAHFARSAMDDVKRGQVPHFVIPYSIEGSAWVTVQSFGKIAAGFGPVTGEWQIQ